MSPPWTQRWYFRKEVDEQTYLFQLRLAERSLDMTSISWKNMVYLALGIAL